MKSAHVPRGRRAIQHMSNDKERTEATVEGTDRATARRNRPRQRETRGIGIGRAPRGPQQANPSPQCLLQTMRRNWSRATNASRARGARWRGRGRPQSFRRGPNERASNDLGGTRARGRETQTRERGQCGVFVFRFPMSACRCARARVLNEWNETEERREEETTRDLTGMRDGVARAVVDALRWAFLSHISFARFKWDGDNSATALQQSGICLFC